MKRTIAGAVVAAMATLMAATPAQAAPADPSRAPPKSEGAG
ncbi:hypothetical protein [Nonomuraea composti]|nr:hypothetical protein [Nonomuraea sp. FMUSA5-5]